MSSWGGQRVHFRERKMPQQNPVQPPTIQPQTPTVQPSNEPLSKYVFTNSNVNDAVVCAIAFEEELYIDEWIKYNLALGFSHIYIYDNSDSNVLKDKKSNNVTIIHFPGDKQMLTSRNIFLVQYKNKHKWVAHIDIDEFIVLKKHANIIDFLNEYDDCDSIALNWLMFGTSNEIQFRDEPITKRFRYCSKNVDIHYKCISKLKSIFQCVHSHRPMLNKGSIYDTNRKIITDIFNPDGDDLVACIHHYYTKSEEEFKSKIERRMVDEAPKRSTSLLDGVHLRDNDVYNSDAWNFYSRHL
jgi:hypothetical protein